MYQSQNYKIFNKININNNIINKNYFLSISPPSMN